MNTNTNLYFNRIELVGVLTYVPGQPMQTGKRLIHSMKMEAKRPNGAVDELDLVWFDRKDVPYKAGDSVRLEGAVISSVYDRKGYNVDKLYQSAVEHYYNLFREYPTTRVPVSGKGEIIDWDKLVNRGLIPFMPHDTLFQSQGNKLRSEDAEYLYEVNEHLTVTKKSPHTACQVMVTAMQPVKADDNRVLRGVNQVHIQGHINKVISYFPEHGARKIPYLNLGITVNAHGFKSYLHLTCWGEIAKRNADLIVGEFVQIRGHLHKRFYNVNVMKKRKEQQYTNFTREIYVNELTRIPKGAH
jgi:hypothetical protein